MLYHRRLQREGKNCIGKVCDYPGWDGSGQDMYRNPKWIDRQAIVRLSKPQ